MPFSLRLAFLPWQGVTLRQGETTTGTNALGLVNNANVDYAKLISNNNIAKRSDVVLHSELQDEVLSKLRVGETKYEMKIHDVMLKDMIRQSEAYKVYLSKECGKGYIKKGEVKLNTRSKKKKGVIKQKKQHITFKDNIVQDKDEATSSPRDTRTPGLNFHDGSSRKQKLVGDSVYIDWLTKSKTVDALDVTMTEHIGHTNVVPQ
nr:hypothetical protein [Tanacetum cinerariifolium]